MSEQTDGVYNVCLVPEDNVSSPLVLLLARDVLFVAVLIGIAMGVGYLLSGLFPYADVAVLVVAFLAAYVANTAIHEWGHWLFAVAARSRVPLTSLKEFFPKFHFDIKQNTTGQFVSMSIGGNVAQWLFVAALFYAFPGTDSVAVGLKAGAFAFSFGATFWLEGLLILNSIRLWDSNAAWENYLPRRAKYARESVVIGTVAAAIVFGWLI
jgi:hypothetical protein